MPKEKRYDRAPAFRLTPLGQEMVAKNKGLCGRVARKYMGRGLSFEELMSAGYEGLCHAAAHFNAAKGWRFSTYSAAWIARFILTDLWDHRTILLPKTRPKGAELLAYYERHRARRSCVPIHDRVAARADATDVGDEEKAALREAIAALPPHYRDLIERRLCGQKCAEIGAPLGKTRQAVQKMEVRAHKMIRRACSAVAGDGP